MTLADGKIGRDYIIKDLFIEDAVRQRLGELGLVSGASVRLLLQKRGSASIIRVRGTRIAVGVRYAKRVEVMPAEEERGGYEG